MPARGSARGGESGGEQPEVAPRVPASLYVSTPSAAPPPTSSRAVVSSSLKQGAGSGLLSAEQVQDRIDAAVEEAKAATEAEWRAHLANAVLLTRQENALYTPGTVPQPLPAKYNSGLGGSKGGVAGTLSSRQDFGASAKMAVVTDLANLAVALEAASKKREMRGSLSHGTLAVAPPPKLEAGVPEAITQALLSQRRTSHPAGKHRTQEKPSGLALSSSQRAVAATAPATSRAVQHEKSSPRVLSGMRGRTVTRGVADHTAMDGTRRLDRGIGQTDALRRKAEGAEREHKRVAELGRASNHHHLHRVGAQHTWSGAAARDRARNLRI